MKNNVGSYKKTKHKFVSQKALKVFINIDEENDFKIKKKDTNFIFQNRMTTFHSKEKKKSPLSRLKPKSNKFVYEFKKVNKSLFEDDKKVSYGEKQHKKEVNKITPFKSSKSNLIKSDFINDFKIPDNSLKNNKNYIKNITKISHKALKTTFKNDIDEEDDDDGFNNEQFNGLKKKTLEIGRLKYEKSKSEKLSSITYTKTAKATSVAGKDSGRKKVNQDSYISEVNVNGILNFNVFGVLDGHGVNGHLASQFAKKYIINRIKKLPMVQNLASPKDIYHHLTEEKYREIADIFIDTDIQMQKQKFNCDISGTTCVLAIQLEEHIICANVGDSRAILIFDDDKNDKYLKNSKVLLLSYDSKPENPYEKKRIVESGGIVIQDMNENGIPEGPFRVWVKGEHYPGLAISRSIGDSDAKKIGVIPHPQIIEYTLNPKSKYMLLCSDGIWEYISNEQAMEIGNKFYLRNDPLGLCKELTQKSTGIWLKENEGDIDDITVIVAFF